MTEKDFISTVKKRLRVAKVNSGMKIADIVKESDLGTNTVTALFAPGNEHAPQINTLKRICDAMGVSLKELFDDASLTERMV